MKTVTLGALLASTDPAELTPRQKQGLAGAKACIILGAQTGKLTPDEQLALAAAGVVFGAVLAGER